MIRIRSTASEAQERSTAFRSAQDRTRRDRLPIVLVARHGRPHRDIATDLGIHRRSVQRRLSAYRERGLSGLTPDRPRARRPASPPRRPTRSAGG